jgi:asparagine synthase (glutamine-hydrolysing)
MCGIAGIISLDNPLPPLERMLAALHHRGPDDRGFQILKVGERNIALGNTRLAIIDLSPAGHMPMYDPETGNWITYNGEIYNFLDLRWELEGFGHTFRSRSDTEVILKSYSQWGVDCVKRLRGMFAFALWDAEKRELFLARDRLGEKPLYYFQDNGLFLFASEVRALLASELIERRLDPTTLCVYFYNGFTIAPRTIIYGIRSLLPGHWMRVSLDGQIRETYAYWEVPLFRQDGARAVNVDMEELRQELARATSMRMISDVPLGAFLSGGLDSSLVVALMSRVGGSVRTFSIGFPEKKYDESIYAEWVARRFQTQHTSILLGAEDFEKWLESGLDAMDQPTYDGLNTYFVARAARESGLTVALSGLGGDELFGGYLSFHLVPKIARLAFFGNYFSPALRKRLAGSGQLHGPLKALHIFDQEIPKGLELLAAYQLSQSLFPQKELDSLLEERLLPISSWFGLPVEFLDFLGPSVKDDDELSQLSRYVLRLFQGERTLRDSDSMGMASSLEVRTVFTDHIFLEKVWKIPGKIRCQGAPHKPFEARLAQPILGNNYPYRRKQGFVFPFQLWLQTKTMRESIREILLDAATCRRIGLRCQQVERIIKDVALPWSRIWALYVLAKWSAKNQASL